MPPLDFKNVKKSIDYHSHPVIKIIGETDICFMSRYLNNPYIEDIVGVFCSKIVRDRYFKIIISQLSTLKICDSYEKKLSEFVFETHNYLIISAFIIELLNKKEFNRILVKKIPKDLFDAPPFGEEEDYFHAKQQIETLRELQFLDINSKEDCKLIFDTALNFIIDGDSFNKQYKIDSFDHIKSTIPFLGKNTKHPILTIFFNYINFLNIEDENNLSAADSCLINLIKIMQKEELIAILQPIPLNELMKYYPCFYNIAPINLTLLDFLISKNINIFKEVEVKAKEFQCINKIHHWGKNNFLYSKNKLEKIINSIPQVSLRDLEDIKISNEEPVLKHSLITDHRKLQKWIEINLLNRGKHINKIPSIDKIKFILENSEYLILLYKKDSHFIAKKYNHTVKIIEVNPYLSKCIPGFLNGNCFEIYRSKPFTKKKDKFWDNWEMHTLNARRQYQEIYHPLLLETALHVLNKTQSPAILEVGGGTGRLAEKIITHYPHKNNYTLLEFNDSSIEKAKERLGPKAEVVKTDIVNDPEYFKDSSKTLPILEATIDLALASGVLTAVVLGDKSEALKVLTRIHKYLKQGGYLIMAGHADSLLASEDFEGFDIINTGLPYLLRSFYIIKKR